MTDTIEQTLRKSREVDAKFKAFMQRKKQSDISMQQTMQQIKQTQKTIANTRQTIGKIDSLYQTFQSRFSAAIDLALKGVQKSVLLNVADPDWQPNLINEKDFVRNLKDHKQILILTGAGMSVASGIPTFRGANGFWNKDNLKSQMFQAVTTPQQLLTLAHFQKNQFQTWRWLVDFYKIKSNAKPNEGHFALNLIIQQLLSAGKKVMITTQNIDHFHSEAKQTKKQKKKPLDYDICQIHGDINLMRCDNCSVIKKILHTQSFIQFIKQLQQKQSPLCLKCSGKLRPHIMFFDQFYSQLYNKSQKVTQFEKQSDMIIVIGTALTTGLSRQIVQHALDKKITIIEINTECEIKRPGTMWMQGEASKLLQKIKYQLWKTGL